MKTFKKIAFLFLCMFLFQGIALPSVIAPVQVEAATKSGLKKEASALWNMIQKLKA